MKRRSLMLAMMACALLAAAIYVPLRQRPDAPASIPSRPGGSHARHAIEGVPYYLQNDPTWGSETIGGSNEPMASVGCTVTSLAMALQSLGHPTTPLKLCRDLKERNGFTDNGYLMWEKVEEITDGRVEVTFPELSHEAIGKELREKRPVIVKILLDGRIPHWVLVVGEEDGEYLIHDPLNREMSLLRLSQRSAGIHAVRALRVERARG